MLIPFGAAVIFKPSPTKGHVDKPLPTGQQGIFWGYRFAPGGRWNGEYLVENLEYFAGLGFPAMPSGTLECYHRTSQSRCVCQAVDLSPFLSNSTTIR